MDKSGVLDKLRSFDAYPKTLEDFKVKTFSGAAVTVISSLLMVCLFVSELYDYVTPEVVEELFVDTTRGQKLHINLEINFHRIPCDLLSIDSMDSSGVSHTNIQHDIMKARLDLKGNKIEAPMKQAVIGEQDVEELNEEENNSTAEERKAEKCGSCYGAETEALKCCNTCDDVRIAYRKKGWALSDLSSIEQCEKARNPEMLRKKMSEGCKIFGFLEVNRVDGNFHISPGKSYTREHMHVHDLQPFATYDFNVTHTIVHLSFGTGIDGIVNPLDKTDTVDNDGGKMFQYYIKVVPTTVVDEQKQTHSTNQFSVTKHDKAGTLGSNEVSLPGVYFHYEMSPMMIKYSFKLKSFGHFLTSVCAIIGGVYTVAGLIDSLIYHSSIALTRKIQLGKTT